MTKKYSGEKGNYSFGSKEEYLREAIRKARKEWDDHVEETVMWSVADIARDEGLLPVAYGVFNAKPGTDGGRLMALLWELGLHPDLLRPPAAR